MLKNTLLIVTTIAMMLLSACGGPITKETVENQTAVEITHVKGKTFRGLVTEKTDKDIRIVLENNHKPYRIPMDDIQSIKEINVNYDDYARPITETDIRAKKTYWRTVSFGTMGALFGGAIGFFVGGQTNSDSEASVSSVETLAGAGAGAAVGVIWGLDKDRTKAIASVRADRYNNPPEELKMEKEKEAEKLKKLEEEKRMLEEKLKNKK